MVLINSYINFTNNNVKFLRENKKITQKKMSKDLNLDQSTLAKWESNSRKITLEWAIKLSEYFHVSVGDFITTNLKEEYYKLRNNSNEK